MAVINTVDAGLDPSAGPPVGQPPPLPHLGNHHHPRSQVTGPDVRQPRAVLLSPLQPPPLTVNGPKRAYGPQPIKEIKETVTTLLGPTPAVNLTPVPALIPAPGLTPALDRHPPVSQPLTNLTIKVQTGEGDKYEAPYEGLPAAKTV